MGTLFLVRHGESQYNLENRFTGWKDPALTEHGILEMKMAGDYLLGTHCEVAFCSCLQRTKQSTHILLAAACQPEIPIIIAKELNERSYGTLEGLSKSDAVAAFGARQVLAWRRGYRDVPPNGESLLMAEERVLPYFEKTIAPESNKGSVLVCAHGNTLRAIVKNIERLGDEEIEALDIFTGSIRAYEFNEGRVNLQSIWNPKGNAPNNSVL